MTLKAVGFGNGEEITGLDFSLIAEGFGTDSDFAGTSSFALTNGAGAREVVISPGRATAWGVDVISDAPTTIAVQESLQQTGVRAWAICIQRDWASGQASIVPLDCGGPTPVRPTSAKSRRTGSTIDHQIIGYAIASPGVDKVTVKSERIYADKIRYAENPEAMAWDPQPGRVYVTPDRVLYAQVPGSGGTVQTVPATKRILTFTWENIQWQQLGSAGQLRLAWPTWPLPFTPFIVAANIHHGTMTVGNYYAFIDWSNPPTDTYAYFMIRTHTGSPVVYKASTGTAISRLTATVVEQ